MLLTPLLALSAAFKFFETGDKAFRVLALRHYNKALIQQGRQLQFLDTEKLRDSNELVLPPLLVALLLFEFEIMAPLCSHSWVVHARGSMQLLNLLNPVVCQSSPLFEIFWQLRFAMVCMFRGGHITYLFAERYLGILEPAYRGKVFSQPATLA